MSELQDWMANFVGQEYIFYLKQTRYTIDSDSTISIAKMPVTICERNIYDLRECFVNCLPVINATHDSSLPNQIMKASALIAKSSIRGLANVLVKPPAISIQDTELPRQFAKNIYNIDNLLAPNELILMYSGDYSLDKNLFITGITEDGKINSFDLHPEFKNRCVKLIF